MTLRDAPLPSPPLTASLAAGVVAGAVNAALLGVIDGVWTLTHAPDLDAGFVEGALTLLYTAGIYAPLSTAAALAAALALHAVPIDVGPAGAWRALRFLVAGRGEAAARAAASLWGGGLSLLVTFFIMFRINRTFMLTFKNQTLSSLLLALVTLGLLAVALGLALKLIGGLQRALNAAVARTGIERLRSPLIPVLLGVGALGALLLYIPCRFEETWDALDLRLPVALLLVGGLTWACAGLLRNRLARTERVAPRLIAAAVAATIAFGGLMAPTFATFGAAPSHAAMAFAIGDRSLLTRLPMKALQTRFDGDGDGYASILAGGDCDDANAAISPGADDTPDNGIDEDCDGRDLRIPPPTQQQTPTTHVEPAPGEQPSTPGADPLKPFRRQYNILWIMIDTLRWDHTGYAGYSRPTTPNIDKLAARSTIFESGYSVSAKTPTAIAPFMASRYPSEMPRSFHHFVYYDEENILLAELLRDVGYLTSASSAHGYFRRKFGMAQGFYRWYTYWVEGDEMERIPTSQQITDTALMMLDHLSRGELPPKGEFDADQPDAPLPLAGQPADARRPWMLYVHYLEPHKHYIDHEGSAPFGGAAIDRYDGEIRFADQHIGRLLERADALDPGLGNTIVVFTSDHGEAFGEHEMRFHGWDLYEHQIRAAFFMHLPGGPVQRVKTRTSLIDLAPTLLDAVGLPAAPKMRGASLLPSLALGAPVPSRPIFTEMPPGPYNVHFRSLTVGDLKLIHRLNGNVYRLYDLAADPGETTDLLSKRPADAQRMKEAYQIFRAQHVEQIEAHK